MVKWKHVLYTAVSAPRQILPERSESHHTESFRPSPPFLQERAVSRRIPLISTSVQVDITNTSSTAQSPIKHSFRFRNRNIMFQFYRCIKSYSAVLLGKYSLYRSQAHLGLKPRLCSNTFNKTQGMSHKCTPASITSQDTFSAQAAK